MGCFVVIASRTSRMENTLWLWLGLLNSISYSILTVRVVRGAIAQLGERNTGSVEVSGSIPLSSTNVDLFRC